MEEERKAPQEAASFCPLLWKPCIGGGCAWFDEKLKQRCFLPLAAEALALLGELSYDKLRQKKPLF